GRTNHRVQLLPLRRIQAPVTPLLELLGGREIKRSGLAELRPHPPVHHGNISLSNLVTGSWHMAPPRTERAHLTSCYSSIRCQHSGTGILPSAMPSASLSSSVAKR